MIKLLRRLKGREWGYAFAALVFIIAQVWMDLKMPDYMNLITQIAQGGINVETGIPYELSDIWKNGAYMSLCAFGSMACSIATSFFVVQIAANFSARLRELLYRKVQGFSMAEINRFNTASLITRTTNDVQQVQMLITMGLQMMVKAPITAVWAITKIAGKQWQWSLSVAVAVIFMLASIAIILLLVTPKFAKIQKMTDDMNRITRESLNGIRIVRAYNAESFQKEKFDNVNRDFTKTNLFTGRIMAFINPVMSITMNGISLVIYWVGAMIINDAAIAEVWGLFGDMVVFMSYGMQIISSFMMLAVMFMIAPRSVVSAKRINEVLEVEEMIKDGKGVGETSEKGTVEFRDVSFRYPDSEENALSHISFQAKKGQTVAFIGSTGCGKSTVVNLVSRFYDATEGSVMVDGHSVREYKKSELAGKIGYVSQKAILFSGDIRSNVNLGDNDADDAMVERALDISRSTEFVGMQKGGVKGHVAQNGSNFSGGQKQRLSIARAVARQAEIYIFDDTFSALDYKTDRELRARLKSEMKNATCLIVAQRIGTIMDADLILVMENGKIAGRGTHRELLESCPAYQEIAYSQLSEEELKHA
ncbi:MAG: ABC transporter ATP-binding protein [Lachnospiraceae bacterium]|jgi:ATP-binding cassette subfamily B multidrug efflux pump|nr:ABC transporter ATP-binding protein [uncultured Acetatifactor sp.]MCI9218425.1 ABC transporter ATP-binding protein [Lachnospiraceae bacterium]